MNLNFAAEAQTSFAFLEKYGFKSALTSAHRIRYQSDRVYIGIQRGERDGEVSISFGRLAMEEEYSFTLFLRLKNPALEKALGERLAWDGLQLQECLSRLADALRQEGQSIIEGTDETFERMREIRWWHFQPGVLKKGETH